MGAAIFYGGLWGLFSALRVLPPLDSEGKREKKHLVGYFFFDLLFCLTTGAAYMLFLFALHNGIFRVYSLLLAFCGAYLLRHAVRRFFASPVFFLFDRVMGVFFYPIRTLLRKCTRKNAKKLDEAE